MEKTGSDNFPERTEISEPENNTFFKFDDSKTHLPLKQTSLPVFFSGIFYYHKTVVKTQFLIEF